MNYVENLVLIYYVHALGASEGKSDREGNKKAAWLRKAFTVNL